MRCETKFFDYKIFKKRLPLMHDYWRNIPDKVISKTAHMGFYDAIILLAMISFISVVSYKYIMYFFKAAREYNHILGRDVEISKTIELVILSFIMIVIMVGSSLGIANNFFEVPQLLILGNVVIDLAINIAILFFKPEWITAGHGLSFEVLVFLLKFCIVVWPNVYFFYGWCCYIPIVLCLALLVQVHTIKW